LLMFAEKHGNGGAIHHSFTSEFITTIEGI
jgi:hypothetical protein